MSHACGVKVYRHGGSARPKAHKVQHDRKFLFCSMLLAAAMSITLATGEENGSMSTTPLPSGVQENEGSLEEERCAPNGCGKQVCTDCNSEGTTPHDYFRMSQTRFLSSYIFSNLYVAPYFVTFLCFSCYGLLGPIFGWNLGKCWICRRNTVAGVCETHFKTATSAEEVLQCAYCNVSVSGETNGLCDGGRETTFFRLFRSRWHSWKGLHRVKWHLLPRLHLQTLKSMLFHGTLTVRLLAIHVLCQPCWIFFWLFVNISSDSRALDDPKLGTGHSESYSCWDSSAGAICYAKIYGSPLLRAIVMTIWSAFLLLLWSDLITEIQWKMCCFCTGRLPRCVFCGYAELYRKLEQRMTVPGDSDQREIFQLQSCHAPDGLQYSETRIVLQDAFTSLPYVQRGHPAPRFCFAASASDARLPAGVQLDCRTGVMSGPSRHTSPEAAGPVAVTVIAVNPLGACICTITFVRNNVGRASGPSDLQYRDLKLSITRTLPGCHMCYSCDRWISGERWILGCCDSSLRLPQVREEIASRGAVGLESKRSSCRDCYLQRLCNTVEVSCAVLAEHALPLLGSVVDVAWEEGNRDGVIVRDGELALVVGYFRSEAGVFWVMLYLVALNVVSLIITFLSVSGILLGLSGLQKKLSKEAVVQQSFWICASWFLRFIRGLSNMYITARSSSGGSGAQFGSRLGYRVVPLDASAVSGQLLTDSGRNEDPSSADGDAPHTQPGGMKFPFPGDMDPCDRDLQDAAVSVWEEAVSNPRWWWGSVPACMPLHVSPCQQFQPGFPLPVFTVDPGLPDGLELDASSGRISGVPSRAGLFSFTITALNREGSCSFRAALRVVSGEDLSQLYPTVADGNRYFGLQFDQDEPIALLPRELGLSHSSPGLHFGQNGPTAPLPRDSFAVFPDLFAVFTISPQLPATLFLCSRTGEIRHCPEHWRHNQVLHQALNQSFVVTALSSRGFYRTELHLKVSEHTAQSYSSADLSQFRAASYGQRADLLQACPGFRELQPSLSGLCAKYSAVPRLPDGLCFDINGNIYGKPTETRSMTKYRITIANDYWGQPIVAVAEFAVKEGKPGILAFFCQHKVQKVRTEKDALNLHREAQDLANIFRQRSTLTFHPNPQPTFDEFRDAVMRASSKNMQVIHLAGHGDQKGFSFLADGEGDASEIVEPRLIADVITAQTRQKGGTVDCVVLNACNTEEMGRHLRQMGVSHVVCWRTEVHDTAARAFASAFYNMLDVVVNEDRNGAISPSGYAKAYEQGKLALDHWASKSQPERAPPRAMKACLVEDTRPKPNNTLVFLSGHCESVFNPHSELSTVETSESTQPSRQHCSELVEEGLDSFSSEDTGDLA